MFHIYSDELSPALVKGLLKRKSKFTLHLLCCSENCIELFNAATELIVSGFSKKNVIVNLDIKSTLDDTLAAFYLIKTANRLYGLDCFEVNISSPIYKDFLMNRLNELNVCCSVA